MLAVDHSDRMGGAEFSLEMIVGNMPKSRYTFTIALPGPGPFEHRLKTLGLDVLLVPLQSWRWWTMSAAQVTRFIVTLPLQFVSLFRWIAVIRSTRPELVYLNINRLVEPLLAARLLGVPAVVHFRDIPSRMRYRFAPGRRPFFALMRLADAWIANSSATAQDIAPFASREIAIIPNGLDLAAFDVAVTRGRERARALLAPARFHVVMIGGLNPWKRQADFVNMALTVLRGRSDTAFYLVGPRVDEAYARSLERTIAEAGAAKNVRLLDDIDCVPALLEQVDVMAHTMPDESFGRVFLEAMAAGCPVVAIARGGAAELIVPDETGILVPVDGIAEMASAVSCLLDDPDRRRRLGAGGRARARASYSAEQHCAAIADLYDAVLSRARK